MRNPQPTKREEKAQGEGEMIIHRKYPIKFPSRMSGVLT